MSQEFVEQVLGRLISDKRYRRLPANSLEEACRQGKLGKLGTSPVFKVAIHFIDRIFGE